MEWFLPLIETEVIPLPIKKKELSLYPHSFSFLLAWGMKATNPSFFFGKQKQLKEEWNGSPPMAPPPPLVLYAYSFLFLFFFFLH